MSKTTVGIDIGTYQVKVIIAKESEQGNNMPKIIGSGFAETRGLRHGYIINQSDAIKSIRKAVKDAEKESGIKIEKAYVSIGGIGLSSHVSSGSVMVSRADSEITELDIEKAMKENQDQLPKSFIQNRQIIHSIPIEFKIDGKQIFGNNPLGMKGIKLDIKVLYIACLSHHLQELIKTVENSGIEIIDVMASPLAAGLVNLSKTEKIAGCVLANIGSETVSIVVYENDIPISLEVFPIGSNDITNVIALNLKISLEQAEKIKIDKSSGHEIIDLPKTDLNKIIGNKISDIFELIEAHLKKIGKNGLLPAGIILTGGGSGIINITDIAKTTLKLPSKIAKITNKDADKNSNINIKIKDSNWSVSYGLCVFGLYSDDDSTISINFGHKIWKKITRKINFWFKKFLP